MFVYTIYIYVCIYVFCNYTKRIFNELNLLLKGSFCPVEKIPSMICMKYENMLKVVNIISLKSERKTTSQLAN